MKQTGKKRQNGVDLLEIDTKLESLEVRMGVVSTLFQLLLFFHKRSSTPKWSDFAPRNVRKRPSLDLSNPAQLLEILGLANPTLEPN